MSDEQISKPPSDPDPDLKDRDAGDKVEAPPAPQADPIRRVTRIVLIVCAAIFVWYLFADRFTPYTDQARVNALLVPIVPRVSGYLTEVNVRLHSVVKQDDVMFVVDQRPFELAVRSAEANLDNTAQQVGAQTAAVKSAAGRDMFISGGENVYPAEIEAVIYQHPAVHMCAVIGVPDPKWGEVGQACVVLKAGASATEEELIAFMQDHLARYKVPKSVEFLSELPISAAGKILKRELQERLAD